MEGVQVSHTWCMCVVGHGYGGLGWCRDGGGGMGGRRDEGDGGRDGGGKHARQSQGAGMEVVSMRDKARGAWSRIGRCQRTFRVRGDTLMRPDHTAVQVHSSG